MLDCEPVDDAPILDLRIRKGIRRHGVKLAVASSRPSSLDAGAAVRTRFAPGAGEALLVALDAALGVGAGQGSSADVARLAARRRRRGRRRAPRWPRRSPRPARTSSSSTASGSCPGHAASTPRARCSTSPGAWGSPAGAPARACCACRPGRTAAAWPRSACCPAPARATREPVRDGPRQRADRRGAPPPASSARCTCCTSTRCATCPGARPGRARWTPRPPSSPTPRFLTEGIREHATVVFPAESYAEKEGTLTHPDGRLQRLRPAIGHQGETRAGVVGAGRAVAPPGDRHGRAHRGDGHPAARRRRPVLRRPDARRDRRPRRALARAPGGRELPRRRARAVLAGAAAVGGHDRRRALPAGHLPLGVGRARGRGLARAEVPAPAPARGGLAGRRAAPRRLRGRARGRRLQRRRACRPPSACATRCPRAACSWRRRCPGCRPRRSRARSSRCARHERHAAAAGRGRLRASPGGSRSSRRS